jgi:hypothetical protein
MSTNGPVETKVYAALVGGVGGGAIGSFLLWLLGITVWHVSNAATAAGAAAAAVPPPVAYLLQWGLPGALAWGAAWLAPHTARPDLAVPTVPTVPTVTVFGPPGAAGVPVPVSLTQTLTADQVLLKAAAAEAPDPTPVTTRTDTPPTSQSH